MKEGALYKSIDLQDSVKHCAFNMSHEYGSLIAVHVENRVDVYEPVLLLKLRTLLLEEEATALDLNSGKNLFVGFESG